MRTLLLLAVIGLLTACGAGAGERPTIAPTTVVLFEDDFDVPVTGEAWIVDDVEAVERTPDSILAVGPTELTLNRALPRLEAALEIAVHMAWPGDCSAGAPPIARPIQLVETESGLVLASLVVEELPGCADVLLEYRVDPAGFVTTSSVVGVEILPRTVVQDRWHEYVLVLYPDGLVRWMRDGVTLITSFTPLAERDLGLRLGGRSDAGDPVLYDRVEVRRP